MLKVHSMKWLWFGVVSLTSTHMEHIWNGKRTAIIVIYVDTVQVYHARIIIIMHNGNQSATERQTLYKSARHCSLCVR